MQAVPLQYTAHTSEAGYRRLDQVLLLMGQLQNNLITHRNSATSTHRRRFNLKLQNAHLTDLRQHDHRFNQLSRRLLESTARRVNKAFTAYFKAPAERDRPHTKNPFLNRTLKISEPPIQHLKLKPNGWATIKIKGMPTIRFRTDQRLPKDEQPKLVQVIKTQRRLTVTLTFQMELKYMPSPSHESVGIDPGVKNNLTAVSDTGTVLKEPGINDTNHRKTTRRLKRKMQRQRDAALKEGRARFISQKAKDRSTKRRFRWNGKPSNSYLKVVAQLRRVEQKRQDTNNGQQHRLSHQLARDHRILCMEDTQTQNMTKSAKGTVQQPGTNVAQKRGLNREILSQGWYGLRRKVEYKSRWYSRTFVPVPAAFTSQTCSQCSHVDPQNRVRQDLFRCLRCGYAADADENAAEVIRRKGLEILARAENPPGRAAGHPMAEQSISDGCTHEPALLKE